MKKPALENQIPTFGLAKTVNPMMQTGLQINTAVGATSSATAANGGAGTAKQKIVLVKGILHIDPKLSFLPDWMYV